MVGERWREDKEEVVGERWRGVAWGDVHGQAEWRWAVWAGRLDMGMLSPVPWLCVCVLNVQIARRDLRVNRHSSLDTISN